MDDLPEEYEINEADIEKMIRHLQIARPEGTITPEMAISQLEEMYDNFHNLAHANPELLEKWYEELQPATESDRSV